METIATSKRRTYSSAEKTMLLEEYKTSGASKKQWCKERGIGLSTLHKWLQNDKNLTNPQDVETWVQVTVTPETTDTLPVQIGKFTIPIAKHTDLELLSRVLKVVMELC